MNHVLGGNGKTIIIVDFVVPEHLSITIPMQTIIPPMCHFSDSRIA